jgi:hypothetical protein
MAKAFSRALVFYAVATVLLVPFVILLFGLAIVHLSYLFFAALPPVLLIALVIHRGALSQAAGHWWRWQPSGSSVAWVAASVLWLSALGAVITVAPRPLALAAAGVAGLLTARADAGLVAGIARSPVARRRFAPRLVPVALLMTFAVVGGGVRVGFALTTGRRTPPPTAASSIAFPAPGTGGGHPVLVAAGNNSRWDPTPPMDLPAGFVAWRYSYRGLDDLRRPRAYEPADTLQPLERSAAAMAQQIETLYRAYGEPVTVLAESEGALVAGTYLLTGEGSQTGMVDRFVIFDMPSGSPGVYYPQAGRQGWGVGSGWGLRGLALVVRALSPLEISADSPFVRDLVDCRSLIARVTAAPAPGGVGQIAFRALADAVDGPVPSGRFAPNTYVVTAPHGGLVSRSSIQPLVAEILDGVPAPASVARQAVARLITAVSDPWHAPSLADRLVPAAAC